MSLTISARESLIASYSERARAEIFYGSSEFAAFYARQAAHYASALLPAEGGAR